jgi:methionyl-tRNA formyltransferase
MSRFVYFGTPTVASETLALLLEHHVVPTLVVSSPDAPRGRGLALTPSPTKALAESHSIPVITPDQLNDETIKAIMAYECEIGICVAYGKLFPEGLISAFPKGVLNIHYSLLPKYRGATPLEGALLGGEKVTGITIQKMVKALDAGDIVTQRELTIKESDTAKDLRPRLITLGAEALIDILPSYLAGSITPTAQEARLVSHSGKFAKADGELSLTAPAEENWRKYRAFNDSIGTFFFKEGRRYKITRASYDRGHFLIERVIPEGKQEQDYVID